MLAPHNRRMHNVGIAIALLVALASAPAEGHSDPLQHALSRIAVVVEMPFDFATADGAPHNANLPGPILTEAVGQFGRQLAFAGAIDGALVSGTHRGEMVEASADGLLAFTFRTTVDDARGHLDTAGSSDGSWFAPGSDGSTQPGVGSCQATIAGVWNSSPAMGTAIGTFFSIPPHDAPGLDAKLAYRTEVLGNGNGAIETGEAWLFLYRLNLKNPSKRPMRNITVLDGFARQLAVPGASSGSEWIDVSDGSYRLIGRRNMVFVWSPPDIASGDAETAYVALMTGRNARGIQEYVQPGHHHINTGATAIGTVVRFPTLLFGDQLSIDVR